MLDKKVSIIIPVYKVEKYLSECLESLMNQTYSNLEIIVCDDESPDRCPQICDQYAKRDKRFKVLHKKNGGAASARNMGLEVATGEFICFVDSDDFVDRNYIKQMVECMEINNADISVCAFSNVFVNYKETIEIEEETYSAQEYLKKFLADWKCGLIWNKLFKRSLIRKIRFAEGHVIDDEFFTYQLVMNASHITTQNKSLYNYRKRKSGVMHQGRIEQILVDRMEYMTERFEKVTFKYPNLYVLFLQNLADNIISLKREAKNYPRAKKKIAQIQNRYFLKIIFGKLKFKEKYAFCKAYLFFGNGCITEDNDEVREYFE